MMVGEYTERVSKGPEAQLEGCFRRDFVRRVVARFPERYAFLLFYRFGLGGGEGWRLDDVGQVLGVHRERVRQMEARALRTLRRHPQSRELRLWDEGWFGCRPSLSCGQVLFKMTRAVQFREEVLKRGDWAGGRS